jgi:hypothetical protein
VRRHTLADARAALRGPPAPFRASRRVDRDLGRSGAGTGRTIRDTR